jgi:hypothetical protein
MGAADDPGSRYLTSANSASSAALEPDRTTELTITATDWTYRPANKYASAQRPLFGTSVRVTAAQIG